MAQQAHDAAEGALDEVRGRVEEAAGVLTRNEDLGGERAAQQRKAAAERNAADTEAEADAARARASADEVDQRRDHVRQDGRSG